MIQAIVLELIHNPQHLPALDETIEGHRGNMIEHRAEFQTEPTLRRQEGIARDLWVHLAIAQDEVRQHGKHGFTRRALYPPDGDPTHTEADIMRVTGETPASATGRL